MGFGTELLLALLLGFLVLGPKQMHAVLGHVARAKIEFDKATRNVKSQLASRLPPPPTEPAAVLQAAKDVPPPV
ncbi:MAG TPA: hypothetical protein VN950_21885 [Terriglobales bacterium]|nr:hypothetical protein [Terriglobales bacterium]